MPTEPALKAVVDFECLTADCAQPVELDLMALPASDGLVTCPHCRTPYQFGQDFLRKLEKLRVLVLAVQEARDILGDCDVVITTAVGDVRIPYRLLLTRLNTLISLKLGDRTVGFRFRLEPLDGGSFR